MINRYRLQFLLAAGVAIRIAIEQRLDLRRGSSQCRRIAGLACGEGDARRLLGQRDEDLGVVAHAR